MAADARLPAALYTRPEAFQRERRSVFQNAWLLLARADAVKAPGSYVAQNLGGWPVFAIADADGIPAGFRNVCRHQGLPLFDSGTGSCEQIRCRYHGWTYDSAGRFVSAPTKVSPTDPNDPMHRLERVAVGLHYGLLFVHLGAAPPPLAPTMSALDAALSAASFDTLEFHTETVTDMDANWKLVMEQAVAATGGVARTIEWPSVILDAVPEGAILHQVIPRGFQRSRVYHHHYVAPGADAAALRARTAVAAEGWRAACAAAQSALEIGGACAIVETPALADFHALVRAAHSDLA
jgi:nitrite reductase/ring-hydroxylating ferredoxin subunit